MTLDLDRGVRLAVLYPEGERAGADDTLVLRLDYGQTCVLFLNGAGAHVERALGVSERDVRCEVLQVGARKEAPSAALLEAVQPASVALSGDVAAKEKALQRWRLAGTTIVSVSGRGSVEFVSDGERVDLFVRR